MTRTEIANMALAHLGSSKTIQDLDTENSKEAKACRTFYETVVDEVLRNRSWPFATQFADLALVEEDPTDEWSFSYRYPVTCLMVRRIPSGIRNDNRQSRVPYRIGSDDQGKLIYTDKPNASIEYTHTRGREIALWSADMITAVSYTLAARVAPLLTGGDPFKIQDLVLALEQRAMNTAAANAFNEEQAEEIPDSEFIRARDSLIQNRSDWNR